MSLARVFGGTEKMDIASDQQRWLNDKLAVKANENIGVGAPAYSGQITPGSNANLDYVNYNAQNALGLNSLSGLRGALQPGLAGAGNSQDINDSFRAQLAPAQQAFQDQLRQVQARYGDTYGKSGALPRMAALATERYGNNLNGMLGQMTYEDQQASRDRQIQAVGMGGNLEQLKSQNLGQLNMLGNQQRGFEGQDKAEDFYKWNMSRDYNNPWLQAIAPALSFQGKGQQQTSGFLNGSISAIGGLAGAAGGMV